MKLWLTIAFALVFFSGCNSGKYNTMLRNKNAKQLFLIKQQQAKIAMLEQKLKESSTRRKRKRQVFTIPNAPKKNIKLKKVEDNNYSSKYMYPETKKKKSAVKLAAADTNIPSANNKTSTTMNKASCIAMIGQAKFDKYTQMFGGEAGSIKRCKMLKAMR